MVYAAKIQILECSIFCFCWLFCLLSIVNSAPVNCKAFDAARWRMINLKLCQTAQSLTHKGGDRQSEKGEGCGGGRDWRHFWTIKTATVWCQRHELQLISDKVHKNNQPNGRGNDPGRTCPARLLALPLSHSDHPLPSMWTIPIPVQSAASSYNLHQMFKCCSAAVGGLLYLFYCFRSCTCVCMCEGEWAGKRSSELAATACGICGFDALQAQPHVNDIRRSLLVRGCLA